MSTQTRIIELCAAVIVGAAFSASAHPIRDPSEPIRQALASRDALVGMMAERVDLGAVLFVDPTCDKRFGRPQRVAGADRAVLAACIFGMHASVSANMLAESPYFPLGTEVVADDGIIVKTFVALVELRGGEIRSIRALGNAGRPTAVMFEGRERLVPSARTQADIKKLTVAGGRAEVSVMVCHDAQGAVTVRRIVTPSGVAAFDREALAHDAQPLPPVTVNHHTIVLCEVGDESWPN